MIKDLEKCTNNKQILLCLMNHHNKRSLMQYLSSRLEDEGEDSEAIDHDGPEQARNSVWTGLKTEYSAIRFPHFQAACFRNHWNYTLKVACFKLNTLEFTVLHCNS